MSIKDLVELFEANDTKGLDDLFTDSGFALTRISKQDNHSNEVETGEFRIIYEWKPIETDSSNRFNYINFAEWPDDDMNSLDIQIKEESLFTELFDQALLLEGFEKYGAKGERKNWEIFSCFFNSKRRINIQFIKIKAEFLPSQTSIVYTIFINRYRLGGSMR